MFEPEDRDQVSLHLVGAPTEGEDVHRAQHAFDPAASTAPGESPWSVA